MYRASGEGSPEQAGTAQGIIDTVYPDLPDNSRVDEVTIRGDGIEVLASDAVEGRPITMTVYHGTPDARFDSLKDVRKNGAIWFTDDYKIADTYADSVRAFDYQGSEPAVLTRTVTLNNPKVVDAGGRSWRSTRDEVQQAKKEGYDGIVIKNVIDPYTTLEGKGKVLARKLATTIAVFDEATIKTADELPVEAPVKGTSSTVDERGFTHVFDGADDYVEIYHGTSSVRASKIAKEGFRTRAVKKQTMGADPPGNRDYVWFSKTREGAERYAELHEGPTVITARIPKSEWDRLNKNGIWLNSGPDSFWTKEPIPAKYIVKTADKLPVDAPVKAPDVPVSRADLPREGRDALSLAEMNGFDFWDSQWERVTVKIADIPGGITGKKLPVSAENARVQARSYTDGPLMLDADNRMIDGYHRISVAIGRGDTEIEVFRQTKRPPTSRPNSASEAKAPEVPQRADIPDLFVESGTNTLSELARYVKAKSYSWYRSARAVMANGYYHGTSDTRTIYQQGFSHQFTGNGNDQWGPGFYFTDKEDTAQLYATQNATDDLQGQATPGVIKARLKIRNPIRLDRNTHVGAWDWPPLTRSQAKKMLDAVTPSMNDDQLSDWGEVAYDGRKKVIDSILDMYEGQSPAMLIYDLFKDYEHGLRAYSHASGFDGVVVDFGCEKYTIAWFPEQIDVDQSYSGPNDTVKMYHGTRQTFDRSDGGRGRLPGPMFVQRLKGGAEDKPAPVVMTVYHGTNSEGAGRIYAEGFLPDKGVAGMAQGDSFKPIYVTPYPAVAKWFAENNTKAVQYGGPAVVRATLTGALLKIKGKTDAYGAFGKAQDILGVPLSSDGTHHGLLDYAGLEKALKEAGYVGVQFYDSVSGGRTSYAVFDPSALVVKPDRTANGRIGWYRLAQGQATLDFYDKQDRSFEGEYSDDPDVEAAHQVVEMRDRILHDFYRSPKSKQYWPLVPVGRLVKIWTDYVKGGLIRDEKGLEQIAKVMIENTYRLWANTHLWGHGDGYSEMINDVAPTLGYEYSPQVEEDFSEHITGPDGQWRISDYALQSLAADAVELMRTFDPRSMVQIVDRMLNRIHQRSDISALFIEGGVDTLNQLAGYVKTQVPRAARTSDTALGTAMRRTGLMTNFARVTQR